MAGANFLLFLLTLVAKESGEALQQAKGGQLAIEHGQLGSVLPWFVLVMTAASAAVAGTSRNRALGPIAVVVSIIARSRRSIGRSGPVTRARARYGVVTR